MNTQPNLTITTPATSTPSPNQFAELIQELESFADEMAINRRISLASLLSKPSDILHTEHADTIKDSIDACVAYYAELMNLLLLAQERLATANGGEV